jgi:serine/threonine protein kinase
MLSNRRYTTASECHHYRCFVDLTAILGIVDVWSIGCILAELIAGKPIFKGKE